MSLKGSLFIAMIRIKRVGERPAENGGIMILADRLWARGVKKDDAKIDYWFKDSAPAAI